MKHILTQLTFATALVCGTAATAEPFCMELTDLDQLPTKYQKRGPFYSDAATGWIIGQDQLRNKFAVTDEAVALWRDIKMEFDKTGTRLVVLAAPPRPLFAPKTAIDGMALPADVDLAALKKGFATYIDSLNSAGIVAPDLSDIANSGFANDYYFARDTHWTPMGAALSAANLHAAMGGTSAQASVSLIDASATYEEKGSLAGVAKDVCGTRPAIETVAAPQYAQSGTAASLLGDAPAQDNVALIGTSFSDRYQRDAYRVADALAFVMKADVDNFSVTGGGMVGSMEAFIRSGALANGNYKTVVWETPYSTPLTQVHGLRQILGALQTTSMNSKAETVDVAIGKDWNSANYSFAVEDVSTLEIETGATQTGRLSVELIDVDDNKFRFKLVKSDRIDPKLRSSKWAISLNHLPKTEIVRVKLRLAKSAEQQEAVVTFFE